MYFFKHKNVKKINSLRQVELFKDEIKNICVSAFSNKERNFSLSKTTN